MPKPQTDADTGAPKGTGIEERAGRWTHTGVAYRFVRDHGAEWKYVPAWSNWVRWTGQRWQADDAREVINEISSIGDAMREEAHFTQSQDLAKFADRVQNMDYLSQVERRARSLVPVDASLFEKSRTMLVCPNGTVDLERQVLLRSKPEHLNMHMTSVVFDPRATCPRWMQFLDEVTQGNPEQQGYLQRAVGYTLSGFTTEQCLFILHGSGANGKSVFLSVLRHLMGDYGQVIRSDALLLGSANRVPSDIAQLQHTRYVEAQETEMGARLAEGLVKSVTGGEAISARFLYGQWFSFVPRFKLWIATNHKPEVHGTDQGMWRRMRLVPFTHEIPVHLRDYRLAEKLVHEASGILNWAIAGFLQWREGGLDEPQAIRDAVKEYRLEMDPIALFIDDECVVDAKCTASSLEVYKKYAEYTTDSGARPMSAKRFSMVMEEHGFTKRRNEHGRFFEGIRLKNSFGM